MDDAERASRDEIIALQTRRMAWTLQHAYQNVAHYRKAFDAGGVHPKDFRQLSDLAKFPFTVKTDLRDHYPFGMFAVPRETLVRVHASSGTTGKPIVVGYTRADIDMWSDVMARSIRAAGGRSGMIMHNAYGYGLFTGGLGAHYGAERLGCTVVPVSGGMTERQVQLINDFKPDIITVTPSYMLAILDEFKRQRIDPRKSSLKFGIFGAEPWTNAMRAEIEGAFGMDATDIYGLSEVIGPGVAQECVETKDGLHVWEDHFYPEVIDPDTGAVLPDGEKGELVFTSLTKEAFPIIRYRTRDLTRLLPGTARPGMRRMEKVTGRSDDMIILRGVNVFPTQIEEVLLATDWCGGHFIIELTREGRMDEMTVHAEARPESWDGSGLAAHAEKVTTYIKNTIEHLDADPDRRAGNAGALARQGQAGVRQAAEGIAEMSQFVARDIPLRRRNPALPLLSSWIASQELAMTWRGQRKTLPVIARSPCDEAIQSSFLEMREIVIARRYGRVRRLAGTKLPRHFYSERTLGRRHDGCARIGLAEIPQPFLGARAYSSRSTTVLRMLEL